MLRTHRLRPRRPVLRVLEEEFGTGDEPLLAPGIRRDRGPTDSRALQPGAVAAWPMARAGASVVTGSRHLHAARCPRRMNHGLRGRRRSVRLKMGLRRAARYPVGRSPPHGAIRQVWGCRTVATTTAVASPVFKATKPRPSRGPWAKIIHGRRRYGRSSTDKLAVPCLSANALRPAA